VELRLRAFYKEKETELIYYMRGDRLGAGGKLKTTNKMIK
jgi:hypothetical protein